MMKKNIFLCSIIGISAISQTVIGGWDNRYPLNINGLISSFGFERYYEGYGSDENLTIYSAFDQNDYENRREFSYFGNGLTYKLVSRSNKNDKPNWSKTSNVLTVNTGVWSGATVENIYVLQATINGYPINGLVYYAVERYETGPVQRPKTEHRSRLGFNQFRAETNTVKPDIGKPNLAFIRTINNAVFKEESSTNESVSYRFIKRSLPLIHSTDLPDGYYLTEQQAKEAYDIYQKSNSIYVAGNEQINMTSCMPQSAYTFDIKTKTLTCDMPSGFPNQSEKFYTTTEKLKCRESSFKVNDKIAYKYYFEAKTGGITVTSTSNDGEYCAALLFDNTTNSTKTSYFTYQCMPGSFKMVDGKITCTFDPKVNQPAGSTRWSSDKNARIQLLPGWPAIRGNDE